MTRHPSSVQFSSVAQSCPALCDSMDHSTPGLPVHLQLPELAQTYVHQVSDAVSSSVIPFSSCLQSFPASGSSPRSQFFTSCGQSTGASALASFPPKKSKDRSLSEWTGWISLQSKGLSRVFPTPQFKSISSSMLSFLHSPTLTSIHDHWKNHSHGLP